MWSESINEFDPDEILRKNMKTYKFRMCKDKLWYCMFMNIADGWHYVQSTGAWTQWGCKRKLHKWLKTQKTLDKLGCIKEGSNLTNILYELEVMM